jgi:hypothetical protein
MSTFAIGAMAQNTDAGTTPANAVVRQAIDVAGDTPLEFLAVSPGIVKSIGLTNNVSAGQALGTETTGVFTVSAAAASSVLLQFTTLPGNLVSGGNNLEIKDYLAGYGNVKPFAGTTFTPATGTTISSFPTNSIATQNAIYVFVGATVNPLASQVAGNYTANIQLTATYN